MHFEIANFVIGISVGTAVIAFLLVPVLRKMREASDIELRKQILTADEILASGTPHVLYLRPFDVDGSHSSDWKLFRSLGLGVPTIEAEMSTLLREIGPVVAIGLPGEELPGDIGAARVQCTDENWQSRILNWMESARLIVIVIGITEGVAWEMKTIAKHGYLRKSIFIINKDVEKPEKLIAFLKLHFPEASTISPEIDTNCLIHLSRSSEPVVAIERPGLVEAGRHSSLRTVLNSMGYHGA